MKSTTLKLSLATLLLSFISLSFIYVANNIDKEKLCKTWYIKSGIMKSGDQEESLPSDMINGSFTFYKNNTVKLVDPTDPEDTQKGTWKDINGKLHIDIDNDPITFTVKTLTDSKLIISAKTNGVYAEMTFSSEKK